MILKYPKIIELYNGLKEFENIKMPFKCSILINRNLGLLKPDYEMAIESEMKFIKDYLVLNEDGLVQSPTGGYLIQDGKTEECNAARKYLDNFEVEIHLIKIPEKYLKDLEFTPNQLSILDIIIAYEEEKEND